MSSDPFVAEIQIFAGNFEPAGWKFCNGQLLPLSQNTALFSLLGTTYGGDGQADFALPDLRGCLPIHWGQGPGLTNRDLGEVGGQESVALLANEVPSHNHPVVVNATSDTATQNSPVGEVWAVPSAGSAVYAPAAAPGSETPMGAAQTTAMSAASPHNNMQPYLALNFIIATQGIFPQRP